LGPPKIKLLIFNLDGKERFRTAVPARNGVRSIGFDQVYYVHDELTPVVLFGGRDFAFVIDLNTGLHVRSYEMR